MRTSVHDPSVVKLEEGGYYIIGSHLGAVRSHDLMNWQSAANSNLGWTRTSSGDNSIHTLLLTRLDVLKWELIRSHDKAGDVRLHELLLNSIAYWLIMKPLRCKQNAIQPLLGWQGVDIFHSASIHSFSDSGC